LCALLPAPRGASVLHPAGGDVAARRGLLGLSGLALPPARHGSERRGRLAPDGGAVRLSLQTLRLALVAALLEPDASSSAPRHCARSPREERPSPCHLELVAQPGDRVKALDHDHGLS